MLKPDVDVTSDKALRDMLGKETELIEQQISTELAGTQKISIALDAWTSPNRLAFLGIVGYWINDKWELCERLLGFEMLEGKHSGDNLAVVVMAVLKKYGIQNRLFAITTDNASNNNTMSAALEDILDNDYEDYERSPELANAISDAISQTAVVWDSQTLHIPCLAHVVQLVVNAFIHGIQAAPDNDILSNSPPSSAEIKALAHIKAPFHRTLQKVN